MNQYRTQQIKLYLLSLFFLLYFNLPICSAQWKGSTGKATKTAPLNNRNQHREKPQQQPTSSFHAANLGRIIFSKSKVDKHHPAAHLAEVFSVTDYLYARVFSEKSAENTVIIHPESQSETRCNGCMYYYDVYVDGQRQPVILDEYFLTDADEKKWTTRQLWLHPSPSDEATSLEWVAIVNGLAPGNHEIRLEYWIKEASGLKAAEPSAVGSFTLVKKAGDRLKMGKSWESIKAGMRDGHLEKAILNLTNNDHTMTKDGSHYTAVKVLSTSWRTVRHRISGVPAYRWVEVNIRQVRADGSCYVQNHAVRQEYNGSGFGTKITWAGIQELAGYGGPLDCE